MSQFRAIAGVVGAAAVAASTPIELFAADPALSADDANANTSFRVVCAITGSTGTQIRVTFQPGSTNSLSILHASFGKWDTRLNYSDTTAAPIELKFGGASGFTGATAAQTSDWADLSGLDLSSGDRIVVIYDVAPGTASTASQRYNNAATGATTYYHTGEESWNVMNTAGRGFSKLATTNYCIASVETRGVGSSTSGENDVVGAANEIPLSFNDGKFTGMTELVLPVALANGEDLSRYSIREQGESYSILCLGNNELSFIRVLSRECVRITDNDVLIEDSYLEAEGQGEDHADVLQAYSPGARGGTVTLRRVHVRAHTTAATAGFLVTDNWGGTLVFDKVIFQGGPWALRLMADPTCHLDIYLKDVYFIGPFGGAGGPYSFEDYGDGTHTVRQWDNVRYATIVDGVLIPGEAIPAP